MKHVHQKLSNLIGQFECTMVQVCVIPARQYKYNYTLKNGRK